MMYRIIPLILMVMITVPAQSFAEDKIDINGVWEWTMSFGPMKHEVSMEVEQTDEKIVGKLTTPEKDIIEVDPIRLDGKDISFEISRETPFGKITMDYEGVVKGDTIEGTIKVTGGPMKDMKWKAKRKESAKK